MRRSIDFKTRAIVKAKTGSKRKSIVRLFLSLGLIAVSLVVISKMVSLLRIQVVSCEYDGEPCPEQYESDVQKIKGSFRIPSPILGLEGFTVATRRVSPQRAAVKISRPIPVVILKPSVDAGKSLAITSDGFVLEVSEAEDDILPPITDERLMGYKLGDRLDREVVDLYKELKSGWTSKLANNIISIQLTRDTITFVGKRKFEAILSLQNISAQLLSLQEILSRPTIEIEEKQIDLRFSRPVIRPRGQADL